MVFFTMNDENQPSLLSQYEEALEKVEAAATESEKSSNVDLIAIVKNISSAESLVKDIQTIESSELKNAALSQLLTTLSGFSNTLATKIKQLDKSLGSQENISDDAFKQTLSVSEDMSSGDKESKARQAAIKDTIIHKGRLKFTEVAGLSEAKQSLREAIIMPLQYPQLFTGGRKPWKRILLYGPPGTGKSRLAQAVSSEIDSTFYCVSSADLVSSWVGESEKLIKELFHHARRQKGRSVIFIDEIDSICRKRSSQEEEHTRRIKTELLKQMEGANNEDQSDQIFLLCATNCPWEIDSAFLRRFQKRIYIPLPDIEARRALIEIHTKENPLKFSDADWNLLVEKTEGYSGSDISNMVLGALFEPVRQLQGAKTWKKTTDEKLVPCDEEGDGSNLVRATLLELPPDKIHTRDVKVEDFIKSMTNHQNTVTTSELEKFQKFTVNFGENG